MSETESDSGKEGPWPSCGGRSRGLTGSTFPRRSGGRTGCPGTLRCPPLKAHVRVTEPRASLLYDPLLFPFSSRRINMGTSFAELPRRSLSAWKQKGSQQVEGNTSCMLSFQGVTFAGSPGPFELLLCHQTELLNLSGSPQTRTEKPHEIVSRPPGCLFRRGVPSIDEQKGPWQQNVL